MSIPTLSDVFLAALETRTLQDRQTLLDEACRGRPEVRQRVERMLEAQPRLGDFLQSPALGGDSAAGGSEFGFLTPPDQPRSLGRLGHYQIEKVIGCGGFGVVFKGHDEKLQRTVAIKALAESLAASATARARFVREAQAAAAVNHENVVRIYAVEEAGPVPYFVMECIEGISLDEKLRREGPLPQGEVLRIGSEIASGLAAAHEKGLVHRDVKPGNILLEEGTGRVKITDFGLARAVDDATISREGLIAGTPEYMSPEQAQGAGVDQRSDLFSLGSVLCAMCTGRSPFAADGSLAVLKRICEDTPQPVENVRKDVPAALADLIGRLHAKNPAERPQSASEVVQALLRCCDGSLRHGSRWASINRRTVLAGLAAAAAGAGSVAFFGWVRQSNDRANENRIETPAAPPPALPLGASWPPRVLFVVPSRDFAYSEVGPVRHQLEMHGVVWRIASTTLDECRPIALGAPPIQLPVKPDLLVADARAADYGAIYFCGGTGIEEFAASGPAAPDAKRLIYEALAGRCTVAACGMGVVVLAEANALKDRRAACYPYGTPPGIYARRIAARGALCSDEGIVEDGPFLTGGAPQHIRALSQALLKRLEIEPLPRGSPADRTD